MKKSIFAAFLLIFPYLYAEENPDSPQNKFSLQDAIEIALKNNSEIQSKRYAVAQARAQYRQTFGTLDFEVGANAQYSLSQNPTDHDDPSYATSGYDNILSRQSGGQVFLKKLFGFGLESKLSYTVSRSKDKYYFPDSDDKQFDGRNKGTLSLELSLPIFKSFKNSIAELQIDSAKKYLEQMRFELENSISKTILSVSKSYLNYFLAQKEEGNQAFLQKKLEERAAATDALVRAGIRSKNDSLQMQVSLKENQRNLQNAKIQSNEAKSNLLALLGISDFDSAKEFETPAVENAFDESAPQPESIDSEFLAQVENRRLDLRSLKKNIEIAENRISIAKADSLPDANLNFGIGATGATYSDNFGNIVSSGFQNLHGANVSGSISVSAKIGNNAKNGAIDSAVAQYNSAKNEYNSAKNTLAIQIKNSVEKLGICKNLVKDSDEVLKLRRTLYDNEQKRFSAGLITIYDLQNQDQSFISAENSYYSVLVEYLMSVIEYKYYTGNLIYENPNYLDAK